MFRSIDLRIVLLSIIGGIVLLIFLIIILWCVSGLISYLHKCRLLFIIFTIVYIKSTILSQLKLFTIFVTINQFDTLLLCVCFSNSDCCDDNHCGMLFGILKRNYYIFESVGKY